MASGVAPNRLSDRHKLLATFVLEGYSNVHIATLVGLSPNRVSIIRNSPLLQAYVERLRREREEVRTADWADRLGSLQGQVFDTWEELLHERDEPAVRARVCNDISSFNIPKRTASTHEETIHLSIEAPLFEQMQRALADGREAPLDVTPDADAVQASASPGPEEDPAVWMPKTIDAFIAAAAEPLPALVLEEDAA